MSRGSALTIYLCVRYRGVFDANGGTVLRCFFFFSSRRRHTRSDRDWSSDVCSSDLRERRRIRPMSFLNKLGIGVGVGAGAGRGVSRSVPSDARTRTSGPAQTAAVGATRAPELRESTRVSNGLKEFLWNLDGLVRGALLDLGPAWQTTLSFFIERGFRVSSEDILRAWKEFLVEEEAKLRSAANASEEL